LLCKEFLQEKGIMILKSTDLTLLSEQYILTKEQISFYQEYSFIMLKNVLTSDIIEYFNKVISIKVDELNTVQISLENRTTYGQAFLQICNLWEQNEEIRKLIFSKRLAQIASDLMQISGVRLYHDQALFKEAGGGLTPWHADQYYWPLGSDKATTIWIPLQETPIEMGPLEFSAGSNKLLEGRNLPISDDSETIINEKLRLDNFEHIVEPFDIGEVSFHAGWVFHRAGANTLNVDRKVMTIIYMDKNMRLKEPENEAQKTDWNTWCPGAEIGDIISTELNPILFVDS
jgi:ectoine hydroxylase-related dioxygenase (phytanoyl-CoA dioxygenase family)